MSNSLAKSIDWFVGAIEADGSVADSLNAVVRDLRFKQDFVVSLISAIGEKGVGLADGVTDMGLRIKMLENTLRFRLSILSPERKGAWFRAASATSSPFKEALYSEPVFSHYDETMHGRVRQGIAVCWDSKQLVAFPFKATDPSLWKILLSLNFELDALNRLQVPFPKLTELPEKLPASLESRALRAFLTNVRAEILSHQNRLGDCYKSLLDASERYWCHHATSSASGAGPRKTVREWSDLPPPDSKGSYKEQRSSTTAKPKFKNAVDLEALKFMGFADFPDGELLKQRYHALALKMHPDRASGNEQRFKMLNKCYKHLTKVVV